MKIALVIIVLAAAGGGFFGWQQHQELAQVKTDLAATKASLERATTEAGAAKAAATAAKKELDDQKAALEQAKIDVEAAKGFLEMEKSHSARLQQELALAHEQMAYMRGRNAPAGYRDGMVPMPVQPRIEAIRIAPNSGIQQHRSMAVPAASPAAPATAK